MNKHSCCIIIPVLNESTQLESLLDLLSPLKREFEIIFVDGGSKDSSVEFIRSQGYHCIESPKGRAKQMNLGASKSKSKYLLFLHADVSWGFNMKVLLERLNDDSIQLANFRLQFDWSHWFLVLNAAFSKFRATPFQFGDQGLWISRDIFNKLQGFDESFEILEDNDIIKRAKQYSPLLKLHHKLIVSARKYRKYGPFKLQCFYYYLYLKYWIGVPIQKLNAANLA